MLVETKLGRLHVEERGAGPAIVCWPSLFCDGRSLLALTDRLGADHRIVVVDGPGHGKSDPPSRPFSTEDCADALATVMDQRGIERAVVLGSAWGGMVSVAFAAAHPERASALVIINAPLDEWHGFQRLQMWLTANLIRLLGTGPVAPLVFGKMLSPKHAARANDAMIGMREADRRGLAGAVRSVTLGRKSLLPLLPALRVPTLVIIGADDTLYPPERARREAARIPGAKVVELEGSAHFSAFELPEVVERHVREFLR